MVNYKIEWNIMYEAEMNKKYVLQEILDRDWDIDVSNYEWILLPDVIKDGPKRCKDSCTACRSKKPKRLCKLPWRCGFFVWWGFKSNRDSK